MSATLRVKVRPGARHDRVAGFGEDGVLRLEVAAPPRDGRANEAVERLLAEALRVPRASVRIKAGRASRDKRVEIDGLAAPEVDARLDEAAGANGHDE